MAYSIPSDIARLDTDGNGRIDRLYVGDMGGQVWRFDIGNSTPANWTGRIIFQSNPGADATTGRKIFYPPDVTLERDNVNYEMLFFGTGDRENPKETSIVNRLYAVKDKNSMTAVTETDLIDVTEDLLQDSDPEGDAELRSDLRTGRGWYIKLNLNSGEKSLSPAVVFNRTAYFTTFTPTFGIEGDPCFVGEGTARVYAMEYNTGNAVFNFDATNDTTGTVISRSDRSKVIGTAIPSGLVITFIGGKAVGYVGVGGGVQMPTVEGRNFQPLYWKTVF
jgi:type IV pilus assembly protein PilY1